MTGSGASSSNSRLWKWLKGTVPYPKALAWCHTTDAFVLRSVIEKGSLQPRACRVFGEDLLYFFYGRPAFRRGGDESLHISARAPVVLIFGYDLVSKGKRLFPFDTGAFSDKRYEAWIHHSMTLADFELQCPSDAPQRHVSSFFGTNRDYLRLNPQYPPTPYDGEYEVDSLVELLMDPTRNNADDRRLAIELQLSTSADISDATLRALIVPDEIVDAPFMKKFLVEWGSKVEVIHYPVIMLRQAREYQALLEERAARKQEEWGLG